MPCPPSYVCVPASDFKLLVDWSLVILAIVVVSMLVTLVEDDPKPPDDGGRPAPKSRKGK